jgi:hypothetical protein
MISIRRNPRTARAPALTLVLGVCALFAVFPAGASAAPLPSGPPQLAFEPGSYDFGLQQANRENSQAMFQLRNNGEGTTQVNYVDIVGPGSGAYWIGMNDCNGRYLNSSESCSVQVNFNPYDAVPFEAQLRASSEEGTNFYAELSGEGGRAMLGAASEPTNFGSAAVGSAGVTKTIEITNSGNYPGGAFIAVIAGGAIGSFQLLDESCTGVMLAPGASCNMVVRFQPLSTGVKTARLGLFGDSDGGTQVTLTGVGTEPEPVVSPGAEESSTNAAAPKSAHKQQRVRARQQRRKRLQRLRQRHHRVAVFAQRAIR